MLCYCWRMNWKMEWVLGSVDGVVRVWFDGHGVAVLADDRSIEESMAIADQGVKSAPALAFRARGSAVVVTDVRVDRDIYYLGGREDASNVPFTGQSFPLGEDEYFLMGDNTQHSSDSRKWKAQGRKLKDGTTVWWDWQNGPRVVEEGGKRWSEVTDVDGILRRWTDEDRSPDGGEPQERRSVVTRDRIVGKAFFALVFWPLDENFLARIRFIH